VGHLASRTRSGAAEVLSDAFCHAGDGHGVAGDAWLAKGLLCRQGGFDGAGGLPAGLESPYYPTGPAASALVGARSESFIVPSAF
jgi:hypothetical protein